MYVLLALVNDGELTSPSTENALEPSGSNEII